MPKKKQINSIPEEFASYEEVAEFWDTHDTTDYPDAFSTIEVVTELRKRRYEVEIDEDLARRLRAQARRQQITMDQLVSELLRKQLAADKS